MSKVTKLKSSPSQKCVVHRGLCSFSIGKFKWHGIGWFRNQCCLLVKDSRKRGNGEEGEDVWREITFMGNEAFRVVEGIHVLCTTLDALCVDFIVENGDATARTEMASEMECNCGQW